MSPRGFFGELKRRHVYKVAVAYAIVGWLLIQIATQVFPFLEIPNWVVRLVIALVAIGFPIALVITWAFELTPVEKDAIAGPRSLEIVARVAAQMGEPDRALISLERLSSMPHSGFLDRSVPFTPALLRLDPMFDPLRTDSRFQKLAAGKP